MTPKFQAALAAGLAPVDPLPMPGPITADCRDEKQWYENCRVPSLGATYKGKKQVTRRASSTSGENYASKRHKRDNPEFYIGAVNDFEHESSGNYDKSKSGKQFRVQKAG